MKTIRDSILGLATLYLVSAIGCAPAMQQKDPHAELDALLGEPVPEVMYLKAPEPKPAATLPRVDSPLVLVDTRYVAKKEAEAYLRTPEEKVSPALVTEAKVTEVKAEESIDDIFKTCKEKLEFSPPEGIHMSCKGEESKYIPCTVTFNDTEYQVRVQMEAIEKQGAKAAYFTLLKKNPRLLERFADYTCSMIFFDIPGEEVEADVAKR